MIGVGVGIGIGIATWADKHRGKGGIDTDADTDSDPEEGSSSDWLGQRFPSGADACRVHPSPHTPGRQVRWYLRSVNQQNTGVPMPIPTTNSSSHPSHVNGAIR